MKTIKFTKDKRIIYLNGIEYKGYTVGDLPNSFGFKSMFNGYDEDGNEINFLLIRVCSYLLYYQSLFVLCFDCHNSSLILSKANL